MKISRQEIETIVESREDEVHAPTPSVVVTNHIIGGLMAAEVRCVLDSENYGEAVRKVIKYDSTKNTRIGLIGTDKPCDCKRGHTARIWLRDLVKK